MTQNPTANSVALMIAQAVRSNDASGLALIDIENNVVTFEETQTLERIVVTVHAVYQPTGDAAGRIPEVSRPDLDA